jgi:hypothetical protein
LSELILEEGIGETRALVVEDGRLVEVHVERASDAVRASEIWDARLTRILVPRVRGIVTLGAQEALIEPLPSGAVEGGLLRVEVVREPIPEAGRPRLPKVSALSDAAGAPSRVRAAPPLAERLCGSGRRPRRALPHEADALEAAGWSEAIDEARSGIVAFEGGLLTISLTPAMTVIDVDGALPPAELAVAGAAAAGHAIRRLGIGGSIGIDLPTVPDKAARTRSAEALDAVLPQPFERTAVNGFGFLQVVRRRQRPSLLERVQGAPVETAALLLLRRAEREPGIGARTLVAAPGLVAWLESQAALLAELERRVGAPARLRSDPALAISGGYVETVAR